LQTVNSITTSVALGKVVVLFSAAMQIPSEIIDRQQRLKEAIEIDQVEVRLIRLPLIEPFETSFGSIDSRLLFLVSVESNGLKGWGEVVASEKPLYSYETAATALHVIREFLGPALLSGPVSGSNELAQRFMRFRGHNMAKAGLELAFMDLMAQFTQQSLSALLGGTRKRVPVGFFHFGQFRQPVFGGGSCRQDGKVVSEDQHAWSIRCPG